MIPEVSPKVGTTIGQTIPHWAGGEPAAAPAAPATRLPYPAVHDMPPDRDDKLMPVTEQTKLETELTTLRSQITTQAATLQQQRGAEDAASKDLQARANAVRSRAEQYRRQHQAEEAERKKLESIARSRLHPAGSRAQKRNAKDAQNKQEAVAQ
jgi:hypothetical protein